MEDAQMTVPVRSDPVAAFYSRLECSRENLQSRVGPISVPVQYHQNLTRNLNELADCDA
jgi:hypothetical protein